MEISKLMMLSNDVNLLSQRGSALDLDGKADTMSKQSLSIIKKGSVPLDQVDSGSNQASRIMIQMRQNLKLWHSTATGVAKSSGYGKDQPKPRKRFQPQINKVKKNLLFFASSRLEEPDLMFTPPSSCSSSSSSSRLSTSSSEPELSSPGRKQWGGAKLEERRARWSLETSREPRWSSTCSVLKKTSPPYPSVPHPPTRPARRLRLWEDSARSQLAFSGSGRSLAVTGAHNSIQVLLLIFRPGLLPDPCRYCQVHLCLEEESWSSRMG